MGLSFKEALSVVLSGLFTIVVLECIFLSYTCWDYDPNSLAVMQTPDDTAVVHGLMSYKSTCFNLMWGYPRKKKGSARWASSKPRVAHWHPFAAGILCFLPYVTYMVVCGCTPTRRYLRNRHRGSLEHYLEFVAEKKPTVWYLINCWHRGTKKTKKNKTVHNVKIVTHSRREEFQYHSVEDLSAHPAEVDYMLQASDMGHKPYLRLKLQTDLKISTRTPLSMAIYKERKGQFVAANTKDEFQDVREGIELPGLETYVLVHRAKQGHALMNPEGFWLASCCLMSVPYQIWFYRETAETTYTVKREIFA